MKKIFVVLMLILPTAMSVAETGVDAVQDCELTPPANQSKHIMYVGTPARAYRVCIPGMNYPGGSGNALQIEVDGAIVAQLVGNPGSSQKQICTDVSGGKLVVSTASGQNFNSGVRYCPVKK